MLARTPTNKKNEPSARAGRVEEIREEISKCLDNARQACSAGKWTTEQLRAEHYVAKKYRHMADAALLLKGSPQQAEIHFRKAFGKSGIDWIENLTLLAAHKILTDLYDLSYREAASIILAIRPAVAKLANEKKIVNLRKKFERFPTKNEFAHDVWQCIWEEAPRDCHPIDFACFLILSIQAPGLVSATECLLRTKGAFKPVGQRK